MSPEEAAARLQSAGVPAAPVRRLSEVIMSSSPGLSTWDADHAGGFAAKPEEYNYKFLGTRDMLACVHGIHAPAEICPTDGHVYPAENLNGTRT